MKKGSQYHGGRRTARLTETESASVEALCRQLGSAPTARRLGVSVTTLDGLRGQGLAPESTIARVRASL